MAIAFIHEVPGFTDAQYEAVVREANVGGPPAGSVLHMAGPMEGGWRIIDVWESREAADMFYGSEAFQQALQCSGLGPPQPTIWPLRVLNT